MDNIYKELITPTDISTNGKQIVTTNAFSTVDSNGVMTSFYTSSAQWIASSSHYYLDIYDTAATGSTGLVQFNVSYGNYNGYYDTDTYDNTYDPAKSIYYQYRNILLPRNTDKFEFAGGVTGSDEVYIITFKRNRIKQELDPGNWELTVGSGSKTFTLIDDSTRTWTRPSARTGLGTAYYVTSGSILAGPLSSSNTPYGIVYPSAGTIVLNVSGIFTPISGSVSGSEFSEATGSTRGLTNHMVQYIQSGSSFKARGRETISSTTYFCRMYNNEFNYSNNPTWVTGSLNEIRYSDMHTDPKVYVSTIGLYNTEDELLAIAKLNRPVLKSETNERTFQIRLDF